MIPHRLFWLALSVGAAAAAIGSAQDQSGGETHWEIKKLAYELPVQWFTAPAEAVGPMATSTAAVIQSKIIVIDPRGSKPRMLVVGASPAWSPDGTQLAYCTRQGLGFGQIRIVNADGTGDRQVAKLKGGACYPDWSPDGTKIAFTAFAGKDPTLFVVDKTGENLTQIATGYGAYWSPDGSKFVFMRGPEKGEIRRSIWIATADGKELKKAIEGDSTMQDARWLPGGEGIVFSSKGYQRRVIYLSHLDGTLPKEIGGNPETDWIEPTFSPDGKQLLVDAVCASGCTPSGKGRIVLIDSDTRRENQLAIGTHPSVLWAIH